MSGMDRQYNSHNREKLKMLKQIDVKIVSLQLTLKSCVIQPTVLRDSWREFHVAGLDTLNVLSLNFVLVRGMIKSVVVAEHRRLRDGS